MDVKRTCLKVRSVSVFLLFLIILTYSFIPWFITPAAVEASWSVAAIPGSIGSNDFVDNVQTTDIAVAGDGYTIYVILKGVLGSPPKYQSKVLFKFTNGGKTWMDITSSLPDTMVNTDYIAVAPDDPNIVVVVDKTAFRVAVSINGGNTWASLGNPPMTSINDVSISSTAVVGGEMVHCVALAGAADGAGAIYCLNFGALVPSWKSALNPLVWKNPPSSPNAFWAVKFSPSFAADFIMLAVSTSNTQHIQLQAASFNTFMWNSAIAGYIGYPVIIPLSSTPTDTSVISADIVIDPSYTGSDPSSRVVFIGLAAKYSGISGGGIYRVADTTYNQTIVMPNAAIASIAFDGTTLAAGAYETNTVYHSLVPPGFSPTIIANTGDTKPGGESNTLVAFAGSNIIAATSGSGSGVSKSINGGATFTMILPYFLASPILVSPLNNASNVEGKPTFSWQAVPYASSYEFEIATDADFTELVYMTNLLQLSLTFLPINLRDDTTYYWRVRSLGIISPSPWSSFVFSLNTPHFIWPWPLAPIVIIVVVVAGGTILAKNQLDKKSKEKTNEKFKNGDIAIKVQNIIGKIQIKSETPFKADKAINVRLRQGPVRQSIKKKGTSFLDGKEEK
jgi:hypothetical protein